MQSHTRTQKTFTFGLIGGLVAGIVLAVGFVAYATWTDPTSGPPTGGYLRVNTTGGTPGGANCTEGGRLHYDDAAGVLYVCDGVSGLWDAVN